MAPRSPSHRQGFRSAFPAKLNSHEAEVSPYGPAILKSTRKETAMSDKEKVALTKLTSKGG